MTHRLHSLSALGASVVAAQTEHDVLSVIAEQGPELAGAKGVVVGLVDGAVVRVAAQTGYASGYLDAWETFALEPGFPMSDAIASGRAVFCDTRAERDEHWPRFRGVREGESNAFVVLPLTGRTGLLGALTLSYAEERAFDYDERVFLEAFAGLCALALERTRAAAMEQRLTSRLAFLSEAGKALARSLDYEETLEEVGRLVVPQLGDWFACDLLVDGAVELVAVSHVDPAKVRWAWELRERAPTKMDAPMGLPNVLRTGRSELYEHITDEMIEAAAETPDELALIREIGFSSVMIVPLAVRGQILGALTLVWAESGRRYDGDDLSLVEELAARVAVAIDNARSHRDQVAALQAERIARGRTERLQRFTAKLAPALTADSVAEVAVNKALVASGGTTAFLALATDGERRVEIRRIAGDQRIVAMGMGKAFAQDDPSVVGEVFRTRTPLWLSDRAEWDRYPEAVGRAESFRSAAILPVAAPGRFFGVLGIAFEVERAFPEEEQTFLAAIAAQTAQALDRARLYEEQSTIAHVLQESLLPQTLPAIPGVELATLYQAAGLANETGGDFYDVFEAGDAHVVVIGDVCGKGPKAAALTSLCRYTLRAGALQAGDADPVALLSLLNRAILGDAAGGEQLRFRGLRRSPGGRRRAGGLPRLGRASACARPARGRRRRDVSRRRPAPRRLCGRRLHRASRGARAGRPAAPPHRRPDRRPHRDRSAPRRGVRARDRRRARRGPAARGRRGVRSRARGPGDRRRHRDRRRLGEPCPGAPARRYEWPATRCGT